MNDCELRLFIRRFSFSLLEVDEEFRFKRTGFIRLLLFFFVLPMAQTVGSYIDNALFLPGSDRGLLEHYGQWSVFIAPPILVFLASLSLRNLIVAIKDLPRHSFTKSMPSEVLGVMSDSFRSFELRGRAKVCLIVLVSLGAIVSAINFVQTANSVKAFGNDTFDSIRHHWGFLFTRISNTILYTVIFPVLIFEIVLVTLTLSRVLLAMVRSGDLYVDFFDNDECGGMSKFGIVNLIIMMFWGIVFSIIVADFIVQEQVASTLIASAIFCSILFVAQSIWGVYAIHACVRKKKSEALDNVNRALNAIAIGEMSLDRLSPIMQLREVIRSTRTLPYTRRAAFLVNVIRFAPPALAFIRLVALKFLTLLPLGPNIGVQ